MRKNRNIRELNVNLDEVGDVKIIFNTQKLPPDDYVLRVKIYFKDFNIYSRTKLSILKEHLKGKKIQRKKNNLISVLEEILKKDGNEISDAFNRLYEKVPLLDKIKGSISELGSQFIIYWPMLVSSIPYEYLRVKKILEMFDKLEKMKSEFKTKDLGIKFKYSIFGLELPPRDIHIYHIFRKVTKPIRKEGRYNVYIVNKKKLEEYKEKYSKIKEILEKMLEFLEDKISKNYAIKPRGNRAYYGRHKEPFKPSTMYDLFTEIYKGFRYMLRLKTSRGQSHQGS